MIVREKESLANHTTFKVGGVAEHYYIPQNEEELVRLANTLYTKEKKLYILSGGSNLLINNKAVFASVVDMHQACLTMEQKDTRSFSLVPLAVFRRLSAFYRHMTAVVLRNYADFQPYLAAWFA